MKAKYVLCFTTIMRERRISPMAKSVYAYLKSYTTPADNSCWPSIPSIARDLGAGRRTIHYALEELRRWTIISWNPGNSGKTNTYFLQDGKACQFIEANPYPFLPPDPMSKVQPSHNHEEARAKEDSPEWPKQGVA